MSDSSHFTSESDSADRCRRSHGREFGARMASLAAATAASAALIGVLFTHRVVPDMVALGDVAMAMPCDFDGRPINAWRLPGFPATYPPLTETDARPRWLWLGNSQLHAINQPQDGERTAPAVASDVAGFPVFGLSLPNASLVEHLVVLKWALLRRAPEWAILPVCYDDLRNDEYRPGWSALASSEPGLLPSLSAIPAAAELSAQIAAELRADPVDLQRSSTGGRSSVLGFAFLAESLQDKSEAALDSFVSGRFKVWRDRDQMWARVLTEVYLFRNWIFGITPQTKRTMIPRRFERNMAALKAIIEECRSADVRLLVYVCPLRFDVEPPYVLKDYEAWKDSVRQLSESGGAAFADLDRIVPSEAWGTFGDKIDFMHFRGEGHRLLGHAVLESIREAEGRIPR